MALAKPSLPQQPLPLPVSPASDAAPSSLSEEEEVVGSSSSTSL